MRKSNLTHYTALCFLVVTLSISGCRYFPHGSKNDNDPKLPRDTAFVKNQLLVLYSSRSNPDTRQRFVNRVRQNEKYKQFSIRKCHCDLQLELWEGDNITDLLRDESLIKGEIKQTSKTGVTGDGDSVSVSLNMINRVKDGSKGQARMDYAPAEKPDEPITVAVLDTGIDTTLFTTSGYQTFLRPQDRSLELCRTDSRYLGWNFVDSTADFSDNNGMRHGSNVTGLILNENLKKLVYILPLKTHGRDGQGTLFDAMCAMKYAIQAKARLINTSWGGYAGPNAVFERVLEELHANEILVVAAAGNEGVDINVNTFFPASYSSMSGDPHPNVISVTTLKKDDTCHHNYSALRVDVGAVGKMDCLFSTPFGNSHFISGSSFAAPVIAGWIASQYRVAAGGWSKPALLSALHAETSLHSIPKIRTGDGLMQH